MRMKLKLSFLIYFILFIYLINGDANDTNIPVEASAPLEANAAEPTTTTTIQTQPPVVTTTTTLPTSTSTSTKPSTSTSTKAPTTTTTTSPPTTTTTTPKPYLTLKASYSQQNSQINFDFDTNLIGTKVVTIQCNNSQSVNNIKQTDRKSVDSLNSITTQITNSVYGTDYNCTIQIDSTVSNAVTVKIGKNV
jgi:hypothetical protein